MTENSKHLLSLQYTIGEDEELLTNALWCIKYLTKLNDQQVDATCRDIENYLKDKSFRSFLKKNQHKKIS